MRDWTDAELRTLATVAETLVRGDGTTRARLAADGLTSAADPAQVKQLRQALRLMESRAVNLALAGSPTSLSAMPLEARERYLLSWGASRLALRRSAFQALRKLLSFLAYAEPGGDGPNPLLAEIGYEADRPPVTADLAAIVPLRFPMDPARPTEGVALDADVVVVGSGAGGGVVAAELAAAGRSVVVLEAGPFVDESTMPTGELEAFDRLYLDRGLVSTWDGSVTILAGSAVGGGTLVNWMTSVEAPAAVREEWARDHGLEGARGRRRVVGGRRRGRSRARRRRVHPDPAQGRDPPARRPGVGLGGGPDPSRRGGLRRLRELPVRMPPRDEAVRDPGPSGDGRRGGRADRARRGRRAGPDRARARRGRRGDAFPTAAG